MDGTEGHGYFYFHGNKSGVGLVFRVDRVKGNPHATNSPDLTNQIRGGADLNCQEALGMIYLYIDHELDETHRADLEQHLEECQECNFHAHEQITLHSALRDASFYYRAPAGFKSRIASSLQFETVWAKRLRARARRDITVPKGI